MQQHNRTSKYIKYILSFFLVLGALFISGQHRATAYAEGSDRIYYFNMDSNGLEGSMILVETADGHWGLMDAGHRYATTIQDDPDVTSRAFYIGNNGLSSQVYCRNGRDVANYMINVLGVTHLDFVIGTHAHSDHIGGIPELVAATYNDNEGNTCYLVDSTTTYYYKEYQHISDLEDDLDRYSSNSWHNQAFAYQAAEAMREQNVNLVNVADGTDGRGRVVSEAEEANYSNYIEFTVGEGENQTIFRLYNLDEQTFSGNENINSIVTVISNGKHTVVNLADININNGAIDKVAQAIADDLKNDFGIDRVDIVVAGHHGYAGSNSKEMFDQLQPSIVVVSNGMSNSWLYTDGDLGAAIPYAQGLFGTLFYNTSISNYATVSDLSGETLINIYSLKSDGRLEEAAKRMMKASNKTGWAAWVNTDGTLWSYLENGKPVKNAWRRINEKMYHFDETGIMETGWYTDGGGTRYLEESGALITGWKQLDETWYYFESNKGYKVTNAWQRINGKMYHFDEDGKMQTGWYVDDGGERYLDENGALVTGWKEIEGKRYYFESSKGYKAANCWQRINGKMYYFDNDGAIHTGWLVDDGGTRYLNEKGEIAVGWKQLDGVWYYFESSKGYKVTDAWQRVNGKMYHFDEDGKMQTGWYEDNGGVRYLDDSCNIVTGWRQIDGNWYYFESSKGYQQTVTGWQRINGTMHYLNEDGTILTGWYEDEGGTRYLNESGAIVVGWKQLDDAWYYFESSKGYRVTNCWQRIDGKMYHFDEDGTMQTGWYEDNGGIRYLDDNGNIVTGWRQIDGEWCFFENQYGYQQTITGWQQINGKWYYFYDDGHMATDTWIGDWYVDSNGVWVEGAVPTRTAKSVITADETDVTNNETENTDDKSDVGTLTLMGADGEPDDTSVESDDADDESDDADGESDDDNADDVDPENEDESEDEAA